jgi:predicted DNA-binding protein (UPF0251 family)
MLTALSWFGPATAGVPPIDVQDELLALLRKFVPNEELRLKRAAEIAIAYGCGAWREVKRGEGGWAQLWQPALDWVTHQVWGWMKATASWLHFEVQLKGYAFVTPFPSWIDAEEVAARLWLGVCDCWRLSQANTKRPLAYQATLRAARCRREHRLLGWQPLEMRLGDFIARALKGDKIKGDRSGAKGFASGAVVQGMLFADLYRESDVRYGRVLVWRCPHHHEAIFEGPQCLKCDDLGKVTNFEETRHQRDAIRRLCVRAPRGPYEEMRYWRCQRKDTYYQEHHSLCPLCHAPRTHGAARSTVWLLGQRTEHVELTSMRSPGPDSTEAIATIRQALQRLSAQEKEVVALVHLQDLSDTQAARQLGVSVQEFRRTLSTALRRLRLILMEEGDTRALL